MGLTDYKDQIELRLTEFLEAEQSTAPSDEAGLFISRISSLIRSAGKRFRPSLLFRTYEAYGGKYPKTIIDLGLALELFHQALLVHDDIIDEDTIRYDGPNIVGYYNNDHRYTGTKIPISMGVLAGDLLLTLVNKVILNDSNLNRKQKSKILSLFSQTTIGVIYGQQLDSLGTTLTTGVFDEKRLISTHSLKSALYTTQLPMRLAATILEIPKAEVVRIDAFGLAFGIYFQLVDDYADYFSTDTVFENHPKFRDYPEGKITYPYYVGLKLASKSKAEFLKKHFGNKALSVDTKDKVLAILENCGADEASKIFAEHYYLATLANLKQLSLSKKQKSQFEALLDDIKI